MTMRYIRGRMMGIWYEIELPRTASVNTDILDFLIFSDIELVEGRQDPINLFAYEYLPKGQIYSLSLAIYGGWDNTYNALLIFPP